MLYGLTRAPSARDHRPDLDEQKSRLEEALNWERRMSVCAGSASERARADDRKQDLERELNGVLTHLAVRKAKAVRAVMVTAGALILTTGAVMVVIERLRS